MILAAGLGTRLRPLTETIPKPLLPVGGTPLIVWNLLLLRAGGIRDVIINLHYLGSMIEEVLGDGARWDMHIVYSHESALLGTGGGLKAAEDFFEGESFLVINGDTLIGLDLPAFFEFHRSQNGVATLVLRDDPQAERWGAVESDAQEAILRINGQKRLPFKKVLRSLQDSLPGIFSFLRCAVVSVGIRSFFRIWGCGSTRPTDSYRGLGAHSRGIPKNCRMVSCTANSVHAS